MERLLEVYKGPCLLDCIEVNLTNVDVFSAKRVPAHGKDNFKIVRQNGNILKEKGAGKIFIERNLHEDFCRDGNKIGVVDIPFHSIPLELNYRDGNKIVLADILFHSIGIELDGIKCWTR